MRGSRWLGAAVMLTCIAAKAQQVSPTVLVTRMSSAYRSMQSYKDSATWKRKIEDTEFVAAGTLAVQRPNRYLLETKGEHLNTLVYSDGTALMGYRPDRKAYTRTRAPLTLMRADVLAGVDQPMLGSRIISLLLEGNLREGDKEIADALSRATVSGPSGFGDKFAYVLAFPWKEEQEARVYVTSDDYLIRRVVIINNEKPESVEDRSDIQLNPALSSDLFARTIPEGSRIVSALPPMEELTRVATGGWGDAPDFTLRKVTGGKLTLSQLKGKVILLNFYFNH